MDELTWHVTLAFPPRWYAYDPDPTSRLDSTKAAVDDRIRETPALAPARLALMDMLLGFWAEADEQGALAAAVLWEPGDPAAVAANLTVVAYSDAPELEALKAGAAGAPGKDVRPRDVTTVDLLAGPAVRVRALRSSGQDGSRDAELLVDVVEHWVPVPGHSDVLLLRGSTPCLDVADVMADVFDQIAGTLEFRSVPAESGEAQ